MELETQRQSSRTLLLLAVALILLGSGWVASHPPEVMILWTVGPGHGLTVGDLPGIAVALVGIAILVRLTRRYLRRLDIDAT